LDTSSTQINMEDIKLPYRKTFSQASKTALVCAALLVGCIDAKAAEDQKLAVVNVSLVFEQYLKVADVQKRIDAQHEARKKELEIRGKQLAEGNRNLNQVYSSSGQSEQLFDAVQGLRKQQYNYERDVAQLNEQIQKDYTREMREVLSDIRQAIKSHAEAGGFEMVLRSPDADNPEVVKPVVGKMADPAAQNKQTYLQKQEPGSVSEVLERFNRNPVLFGASTVDITDGVLSRLNQAFMKRAMSGAIGK